MTRRALFIIARAHGGFPCQRRRSTQASASMSDQEVGSILSKIMLIFIFLHGRLLLKWILAMQTKRGYGTCIKALRKLRTGQVSFYHATSLLLFLLLHSLDNPMLNYKTIPTKTQKYIHTTFRLSIFLLNYKSLLF